MKTEAKLAQTVQGYERELVSVKRAADKAQGTPLPEFELHSCSISFFVAQRISGVRLETMLLLAKRAWKNTSNCGSRLSIDIPRWLNIEVSGRLVRAF